MKHIVKHKLYIILILKERKEKGKEEFESMAENSPHL